MLKNRKLLSIILALTMALTITGQVPAFALEGDALQQPAAGQTQGQEETQEEKTDEVTEEQGATEEATDEDTTESDEEEPIEAKGLTEEESGLIQVEPTGEADWDGKTIDISWYDPEESSFEISTGAQLAGLAALVNGSYDGTITQYVGTEEQLAYIENIQLDGFMFVGAGGGDVGGTCYKATGNHDFMGKTIYVTNDIDMTAGNYMPIGGKYPMCDVNGSMYVDDLGGKGDAHVIEAYFNGIIDFEGHSIKISCDRYTDSGFPYSMAAGLVGYLGGIIEEDDVEDHPELTAQTMQKGWIPAVKNVSLSGSVYARRMVGGVVGRIGNAEYGVHIENCANHANVSSTDAKGCGGVVGAGWSTGKIINCYNTGTITSIYGDCAAGGICASNDGLDIYNCYNVGKIEGNSRGRGIGGHDTGSYTVANCYSLKGCDSDPESKGWFLGTATDISVDVEILEEEAMKGGSLSIELNKNGSAYEEDTDGINDGYPVLFFEAEGYSPEMFSVELDREVENGSISGKADSNNVTAGSFMRGTIIYLTGKANAGCVLDYFTLNNKKLTADFCTVTDDSIISASIVELRTGEILIKTEDSKDCDVSVVKKGLIDKGDGTLSEISNRKVKSGDILFQKDILTASAELHKDVFPQDKSKEYNGEFTYTFKYMDSNGELIRKVSNGSGRIAVSADIDNAQLYVSAMPCESPKTWLSYGSTAWYDDSTSTDTFEICSAEDLAGLAYLVNIEGEDFKGKTINIPEDTTISLRSHDGSGGSILWPGIGINRKHSFKGSFDGNGNTILSMKAYSEEESDCALFGYISGAKISNLTVRGDSTAKGCAAGIIANAEDSVVSGCISYVKVEALEYDCAGGVCGSITNTEIKDCINRGSVVGVSALGGIVGAENDDYSKITRCSNYGEIKSSGYDNFTGFLSGTIGVGGIVGWNLGDIYGCLNKGSVNSTDEYTGGIAGYCAKTGGTGSLHIKVTSSFNNGTITTKANNKNCSVGGILGFSRDIVLSCVYNTGSVSSTNTTNTKVGSVIGVYYSDMFSKVGNAYWKAGTASSAYNYINETDPKLPMTKMTDADMKTAAFASKLASADASAGFVAQSSNYPTFSRTTAANGIETVCKVTFTGAITGSVEVNKGGSLELPEAGEWEKYSFECNGKNWSGENITSNMNVTVTKTDNASYKAIFMANGEMVGSPVNYDRNTIEEVSAPEIPDDSAYVKKGYAVTWPDNFTLRTDGDTVIHAIYYPSETKLEVQDEARIDSNGTWYLGGKSSGTITVAEGTDATLVGDGGVYNNLNIVMEAGSKLTINNVKISCAGESVLTMNAGCELILEGKSNSIEGIDTDSKQCVPAIQVLGNSTIRGDGTLCATSETGDTVIDIDDDVKLVQEDAVLKLQKSSKIGSFHGGLINAGGHHDKEGTGTYKLNSGTLYCAANSDNMHSVKVGTFEMNGGDALIISNDEAKALVAGSINYDGGNLKVVAYDYDENETNKDPEHRTVWNYDADAVDCESFTSSNYICKVDGSDATRPYLVKVEGEKKYEGNGLNLEFDYEKDKFVKSLDRTIYVWTTYSNPDTSISNSNMDSDNPDHIRGYSVQTDGNALTIEMTETVHYSTSWFVAVATYDSSGKMLEFKQKKIKSGTEFNLDTLEEAHHYKVFIFGSKSKLTPTMNSYEAVE